MIHTRLCCEASAVVLHLLGQQAILGSRLAQGVHEKLVRRRIACLAERLRREHIRGAHLQQQLAGDFRQMRGQLGVVHASARHGISIATMASAASSGVIFVVSMRSSGASGAS